MPVLRIHRILQPPSPSIENHGAKFTYTEVEYLSANGGQRWVYTWGDVPNPVKVKYDDMGRRVEMHTYQTGTDVQYTYTRFGALKTVTDTAGTRTFTYRSDLQVEEEQLGDFYDYGSSDDQLKLIYGYAGSGVIGRLTDFDMKAGSVYLLEDGYGYDAVTGRPNQVTGHSQTFTLSYLANSHMIAEVESGSFERHINRQANSHRISSI